MVIQPYGGFRINGGTPIAGWFISGKNDPKWMMTGGTYPYFFGNHQIMIVNYGNTTYLWKYIINNGN